MKKVISFTLVAILLFGISATVSVLMRGGTASPNAPKADRHEQPAPEKELPGQAGTRPPAEAPADNPSAPAVRTRYVPEAEVAVQLAQSLRLREASLKKREAQLLDREKAIALIFKDIRTERAVIDDLRKQVFAQVGVIEGQMAAVTQEQTALDRRKKEMEDRLKELESRIIEIQEVERGNLKKLADTYSMMDPERASKIFQNMVQNGKTETAVKILGQISQRQAAKVFAEMPQQLAGDLIEALKGLKAAKPAVGK